MHSIFVSYSSKDEERANQIVTRLEAAGLKCWIATRELFGSEDYQERVVQAVKDAELFLLVMSNAAKESAEIRKETKLANRYNKAILPVNIEPISDFGKLEYATVDHQHVDIFNNINSEMDGLCIQLGELLAKQKIVASKLWWRNVFRNIRRILISFGAIIAIVALLGVAAFIYFLPRGSDALHGVPPPSATPEAAALTIAQNYYAALSAPADVAQTFLASATTDNVIFDGTPLTRGAMIAQLLPYFANWPTRRFTPRIASLSVSCPDANGCTVSGIFDYTLHNAARSTSGVHRFALHLANTNGHFLLDAINDAPLGTQTAP